MADRRQRCFALAVVATAALALPASASATGFWSDPTGADLVADAVPPASETAPAPSARRAACASRQRRKAKRARRCARLRASSERLGSRGLEPGSHLAPAALELFEPFRRAGLVPR
jgi:hypothetical protein